MVEQQAWALDEFKARDDDRKRQEEQSRPAAPDRSRQEGERFDRDRFLTDTDYRRARREQAAAEQQLEKRQLEREQSREMRRQGRFL